MTADQPTLRDPAAVLRRLIDTAPVMRFDNDYPVKAVPIAELLDLLLPLIEADRERVKAEGGAEALSMLDRLAVDTDAEPCRWDHHGYCQEHGWLGPEPGCGDRDAHELLQRAGVRAAALRGSTGGGT